MSKYDYSKRLDTLRKRRQGDDELIKKSFMMDSQQTYKLSESYEALQESSSVKYVIGAMKPVDKTYTENTYKEGERIQNQLSRIKDLGYSIEFKYQGSVTNNTHIKAHSDIDILTLHGGFISLEPPQKPTSPYKGNAVDDLCKLREDSYAILRGAFPVADIDNSGAKSISLKGGSLTRKVDVVPSNWYNTVKYAETKLEYYRGVMILDYKAKTMMANTPFYHNKLLDDKDILTGSNYKKVVRLLKTIKADSEMGIDLSSYDIAALMYHMDNGEYRVGNLPLVLISKSIDFLRNVAQQHDYRSQLMVPDGSRAIFQPNRNSNDDLQHLITELTSVYQDLLDDLKLSGGTIFKEIVA